MATTSTQPADSDVDISDDEWNGIEEELSAESSDEDFEEGDERVVGEVDEKVEQSARRLNDEHSQEAEFRRQQALQSSQDALSLSKQSKERNATEIRGQNLYHQQYDPDALLGKRHKGGAKLKIDRKKVQNVDYAEDVHIDRKKEKGHRLSSGSEGKKSTSVPSTPMTPRLVVTRDNDDSNEDDQSKNSRHSSRERQDDPWIRHGRNSGGSSLPAIRPSQSSENSVTDTKSRLQSPKSSRPGTPDIAALKGHRRAMTRSNENLPHVSSDAPKPVRCPQEGGKTSPNRPRSPKVTLNVALNQGTPLYSRDNLQSPKGHHRSFSAGHNQER